MIVGVNRFAEAEEEHVELQRIDPEAERRQLERTARGEANLLPPMREALRARCTVGEICNVLREEFGTFDSQRT